MSVQNSYKELRRFLLASQLPVPYSWHSFRSGGISRAMDSGASVHDAMIRMADGSRCPRLNAILSAPSSRISNYRLLFFDWVALAVYSSRVMFFIPLLTLVWCNVVKKTANNRVISISRCKIILPKS